MSLTARWSTSIAGVASSGAASPRLASSASRKSPSQAPFSLSVSTLLTRISTAALASSRISSAGIARGLPPRSTSVPPRSSVESRNPPVSSADEFDMLSPPCGLPRLSRLPNRFLQPCPSLRRGGHQFSPPSGSPRTARQEPRRHRSFHPGSSVHFANPRFFTAPMGTNHTRREFHHFSPMSGIYGSARTPDLA